MTPRLTRHVGLLLGLLVVPVTAGMAQVPDTARSGRLAAVRSLKIGRPIRVTQASGPRVAGVLAAPADTMVTLEWGDSVNHVLVRNIVSIDLRRRSTSRGALWGGGVGLVVGVAYGLLIGGIACAETDCTRAEVAAVVGGLGAASGAVVGAGIGFAIPRWQRVFP
jgi:hypothetical protein